MDSILNLCSRIDPKIVAIGTVASYVGNAGGGLIDAALARKGIAFTDLLPRGYWNLVDQGLKLRATLYTPLLFPLRYLPKTFADTIESDFLSPVLEELEYRYLFPLCIEIASLAALNVLLPGSGILVQGTTFRVMKHVLCAGLFALSHKQHWGRGAQSRFGVTHHFVSGLISSTVVEMTGSVVNSIAVHMLHNLLNTAFLSIVDPKTTKPTHKKLLSQLR